MHCLNFDLMLMLMDVVNEKDMGIECLHGTSACELSR